MKTRIQHLFVAVALCSTLNFHPSSALAQGTAFTYQGRLNDGGNPANGSYDLRFTIQDAASGGIQIAAPLTNSPTSVSNGLFFVTLDFDSGVFPGANRWLEIAVRTNGPGAFVTLAARQQITSTPYAIHAVNAGTATTATTAGNFSGSLSGDVTGTQGATTVASVGGQTAANVASGANAANAATSVNAPNTIVRRDASGSFSAGGIIGANFTGNGGGLTNLPAGSVIGTLPDARLTPNIARLNGTNIFIGTNTFAGVTIAMNGNNLINGAFTGNLNGNATTATSATIATTANNFSGSLAGDVAGTQGATTVASVGGQTAANVANGANAANAATSVNAPNTIVRRDASGSFSAGGIIGTNFTGNGSGLTSLPVGALVGTLPDARLTPNIARLNGTNIFIGTNTFAGVTIAMNGNNLINGAFTGNLNGNATTATSSTTATTANNFSGSLSGNVTGTQGATVVASVGGQSAANVASGASAANAATSANTASTIVKRDASGNFSAGTITGSFVGNGNGLTNVNLLTAIPAGSIVLTTNAGTFGFTIDSAPLTGGNPISVVAADVNGDGKEDLITANSVS